MLVFKQARQNISKIHTFITNALYSHHTFKQEHHSFADKAENTYGTTKRHVADSNKLNSPLFLLTKQLMGHAR